MSESAFDEVTALAGLGAGARVLDLGCGKGTMLLRLVQKWQVIATGLDINPDFLRQGRKRAQAAGIGQAHFKLRCQDASRFEAAGGSYQLVLCVGATHALGGLRSTLAAMHRLAGPGGFALVGEGFWQRPPHPDYLALLQATAADHGSHQDNLAAMSKAGWNCITTAISTVDDWDRYENTYADAIHDWVAAHPDDPDGPAMLQRIMAWRLGYLEHGRTTLGFCLYLLQRRSGPTSPVEQNAAGH